MAGSGEAVIIDGPRSARIGPIDLRPLGPGDVLIDVLAVGICGTDVEIFDGTMPYYTSGQARFPVTPGHEWVGEIVELGPAVAGFAVGDRVVGECSVGCMNCSTCLAGNYHQCPQRTETGVMNRSGGFSQRLRYPSLFLHKISPHLALDAAALVEPTAIAFNGVRKARVTPEDYVAVFGDGPIGLLLLQVAKAFGAKQVAMVGATPSRLAMAGRLGADLLLDARSEDVPERLRGLGGVLPDVILEATGNPVVVPAVIDAIAPCGRIVLQGLFAGKAVPALCLDALVVKDATLYGALGSPGIWPAVIALIEAGRVDPAAIVTHHLPLDQFEAGLGLVSRREAIKVIVNPNGPQR